MAKLPGMYQVKMRSLECPECGANMILRETSKFKHKDGLNRKFYGCTNYPHCTATHGAHPNGEPLGHPGDKATKQARMDAHAVFDDLWRSGTFSRSGAYKWLAKKLGVEEVHFGEMSEKECREAIEVIEENF